MTTTKPTQPYFKGKGEHSVNELEKMCQQYKDYISHINSQPIVEDVSMEDAKNKYVEEVVKPKLLKYTFDEDIYILGASSIAFKEGWKQREQQLLPIIKELGEALKESNTSDLFVSNNKQYKQNLTTLEKYKNYL